MRSIRNILLFAPATLLTLADEEVSALPRGWNLDTKPCADHVQMSIALRQPYINGFRRQMNTGTNLDVQHVKDLLRPSDSDLDVVVGWLGEEGFEKGDYEVAGAWIHINCPAERAELLLNMDLHCYSFGDEPPVLRTREYHVPSGVAAAIDFIHPIANFMSPTLREPVNFNDTEASMERDFDISAVDPLMDQYLMIEKGIIPTTCRRGKMTPRCIKERYNMLNETRSAAAAIGILGRTDKVPSFKHLQQFLSKHAPWVPEGTDFVVEAVGGVNTSTGFDKQTTLSLQYAVALAHPAPVTFYAAGGRGASLDLNGTLGGYNEPFLDALEQIALSDTFPQVLLIPSFDDEASVPVRYAQRVNSLLGVLATRGVTVVVASGDGGARGSTMGSTCHSHDGKDTPMMSPTFPASSPWVLSVGALDKELHPPDVRPWPFSGGGFSNVFPMEPYQSRRYLGKFHGTQNVGKAYRKMMGEHHPVPDTYNITGRAVPDMSTVGDGFEGIGPDGPFSFSGTSAAATVVASMLTLVNEARLRLERPSLGFVNPALYDEKDFDRRLHESCVKHWFNAISCLVGWRPHKNFHRSLKDVEKGQTLACDYAVSSGHDGPLGVDPRDGWRAKAEWDATSGLGWVYDFWRFRALLGGSEEKDNYLLFKDHEYPLPPYGTNDGSQRPHG